MSTFERVRSSSAELRNIRTITTCAVLGAISIILGYLGIQIGDFIKITFTSTPIQFCAWVFGPVTAPILAAVMDIVNYLIKPTGAFFPGFTLSAAVNAVIFGLMLYRRPLSFKRILIAQLISVALVDCCLNTLWLAILYGQAFNVILPMRIVKNLIMWPILSSVLYAVSKAAVRAGMLSPNGVLQMGGRRAAVGNSAE